MTPSSLPKAPILIIGGGVAGLALAHGLKKHQIPFRVFEKDAGPETRSQGYRVRIAGEAIESLKYLLSPATFKAFNLTCGEYVQKSAIPQIDALTGAIDRKALAGRPNPHHGEGRTVDRTVFRRVLMQGLDKSRGEIEFGKAFKKYSVDANTNLVTAFFEDGSSLQGSLLVGADGRRSGVRGQFFPDQKQVDTGGRTIYGKTEITEELRKIVDPEMLTGMSAVKDFSGSVPLSVIVEAIVFKHRDEAKQLGFELPPDYFFWGIASQPERMGFPSDLTKTPHLGVKETEKLVLQLTEKWEPSVRGIFENQMEDYSCTMSIHSVEKDFLARGPEAPTSVTLIGDACHAMTPAGSGALTALRDALHLCRALVEDGVSPQMVLQFEEEMKVYAGQAVELSWLGAKAIFGKKGEQSADISSVMKEITDRRNANDAERLASRESNPAKA